MNNACLAMVPDRRIAIVRALILLAALLMPSSAAGARQLNPPSHRVTVDIQDCLDGMARCSVRGKASLRENDRARVRALHDETLLVCFGEQIRARSIVVVDFGAGTTTRVLPGDGWVTLVPPLGSAAEMANLRSRKLAISAAGVRAGIARGLAGPLLWPNESEPCSQQSGVLFWPNDIPSGDYDMTVSGIDSSGIEVALGKHSVRATPGVRDSSVLGAAIERARETGISRLQLRFDDRVGTSNFKIHVGLLAAQMEDTLSNDLAASDSAAGPERNFLRGLAFFKARQYAPASVEFERAIDSSSSVPSAAWWAAWARSRLDDLEGANRLENALGPLVPRPWTSTQP